MEQPIIHSTQKRNQIFLWIAVAAIFVLGLVIRLYDLTDLPLDFHATRQMRSAIIARGMYVQNQPAISEWQRQAAVQSWKQEGLIEPPILETLSAVTYALTGGEKLWIPRLYSIFFWMLGGAAVFAANRRLSGPAGALTAVLYFLILPYGAIASRSFQPDPLMTALIAGSIWAITLWSEKQTLQTAVLAGVLGGLAILVKSVAVFFVAGSFAGLILAQAGLSRALRSRQVWVMGALTVLPYAIFHIYGVYITGELARQFSLRFFPSLWIDPVFYLRWKNMIASTVGFEWFVVAFLGTLLLPRREMRAMLMGAWIGYFVYGMTLPYHISTHDYYQLPLILLVAAGLGAALNSVFQYARAPRVLVTLLVAGAVLFTAITAAWDVRVTLKRTDYRPELAVWQGLGRQFTPGSRVIGLTHDYGYRLAYWGWTPNTSWLSSNDMALLTLAGSDVDPAARFAEAVENYDYFVVTAFGEFENQPDLKQRLEKQYPVAAESGDYIIFDLRHPKAVP